MDKKFTIDWIPVIDKYIRRLKNGTRVNMVDKHWDDFRVNLTTHIWNKSHLYNNKYPLNAWIKTVVKNQFYNYVRNNFFYSGKDKTTGRAKQNLIFAKSINTIENYEAEDNTYPYEPNDILDIKSLDYSFNKITTEEYKKLLTEIEQRVLDLKIFGFKDAEISKELNRKMSSVYTINSRLRRKYLGLLNKE